MRPGNCMASSALWFSSSATVACNRSTASTAMPTLSSAADGSAAPSTSVGTAGDSEGEGEAFAALAHF